MTLSLRALLRALAGDYEIYSIYVFDLRGAQTEAAAPPETPLSIRIADKTLLDRDIPDVAAYLGEESAVFAIPKGDRFAAACAFQWGGGMSWAARAART